MLNTLLFSLFPFMLVLAGVLDLSSYRIPNQLTIAIALLFLPMSYFLGLDLMGYAEHLGAGLLVFAVTFIMFAFGWIGGGDSKMAAGVALWIGLDQLLPFFLIMAFIGGGMALVLILWNTLISRPVFATLPPFAGLTKVKHVPYGIALAGGGLYAYAYSPWMSAFGY